MSLGSCACVWSTLQSAGLHCPAVLRTFPQCGVQGDPGGRAPAHQPPSSGSPAARAPQSYILSEITPTSHGNFPREFTHKKQNKCVFCHKQVSVTENCFCNRTSHRKVFLQQKPVTEKFFVTLEKSFHSFVVNQTKKFTHFHGTFNKIGHEITEENYFVEPCQQLPD